MTIKNENFSQSIVKECIHNSGGKSCDLIPIHSKLLIECIDCRLPSLTHQICSSHASGLFPQ